MKNNNIYLITDLDRTIIHSKNKGYKCVEVMGDREITYMTDYSYNKLQELLKIEKFKFIPCTMRNIKQTLRVDFIREYNPEIIICTNGAQIYINGELDNTWDKKMKEIVNYNELLENIDYLNSQWEKYKDSIEVLEVRNIEDFYITVKCLNQNEADKFYEVIKNSFNNDIRVIKIEAKIFIIHKDINKIIALEHIVESFNINTFITSGDSEVDKEFTTKGISILPKHSSFKHENSIITKESFISSTDEILDIIEELIKKNN